MTASTLRARLLDASQLDHPRDLHHLRLDHRRSLVKAGKTTRFVELEVIVQDRGDVAFCFLDVVSIPRRDEDIADVRFAKLRHVRTGDALVPSLAYLPASRRTVRALATAFVSARARTSDSTKTANVRFAG